MGAGLEGQERGVAGTRRLGDVAKKGTRGVCGVGVLVDPLEMGDEGRPLAAARALPAFVMDRVTAVDAAVAEQAHEKRSETGRKVVGHLHLARSRREDTEEDESFGQRRVGLEKHPDPAPGVIVIDPRIDERGQGHVATTDRALPLEPLEKADEPPTVLEPPKGYVAVGVGVQREAEVRPEGALEMREGLAVVPARKGDPAQGRVGAEAARIALDGLAVETDGLVPRTVTLGSLGRLAAVMRERRLKAVGRSRREPKGRDVGRVPLALVLVDREKVAERTRPVRGIVGDILEEGFGAVVKSRREIVAGELVERTDVDRAGEIRAGDEALVDADGALEFTPPPEEMRERKLHFVGLRLALGEAEEHVHGPVGFVVQEETQALERAAHGPLEPAARSPSPPSRPGPRQRQKHKTQEERAEKRGPYHGPPASASSPCGVPRREASRAWRR